jgi:hypothetical protein
VLAADVRTRAAPFPPTTQENIGNQYSREGQVARARAYYARAAALLDAAEGADGVREARRKLTLNSALVSSARDEERSGSVPYARSAEGGGLAALEAAWHAGGYGDRDDDAGSEFELDEAAGAVCRNALLQCSTAAAQLPWLRRFLALRRGRAGAGAAARLAGLSAVRGACRACAQPAAAVATRDAGAKLRLCTACSGVAYCSTACQAADWARHKRHCKAAVAAAAAGAVDAAAALADATCSACHAALVPDDGDDANAPGVGLVTILRCDHAVHAKCLDAVRAAAGVHAPVLCPTCGVPFQVPLSPMALDAAGGADGPRLVDLHGHTERSVEEMAASMAASGNMPPGFHGDAAAIAAQLRAMGILGMSV